jgi:uncharacterized membrane protein (UPF0127 family)
MNLKRISKEKYSFTLFFVLLAFFTVLFVQKINNFDIFFPKFTYAYHVSQSTQLPKSQFKLSVAMTQSEIEKGLMFVTTLDAKTGMLFEYTDEKVRTFWMKNTFKSLDIIFLDSKKQVITLVQNATPLDSTILYSSLVPAQYVIELKAGSIENSHIKVGDRFNF